MARVNFTGNKKKTPACNTRQRTKANETNKNVIYASDPYKNQLKKIKTLQKRNERLRQALARNNQVNTGLQAPALAPPVPVAPPAVAAAAAAQPTAVAAAVAAQPTAPFASIANDGYQDPFEGDFS